MTFHENPDNFTGDLNYFDFEGDYSTIGCNSGNDGTVAAEVCANLTHAGSSNWYLPAQVELREDFGNSACGCEGIDWSEDGGSQNSCNLSSDCGGWDSAATASYYWSSSESSSTYGRYVHFFSGSITNGLKTYSYRVRCRLGN